MPNTLATIKRAIRLREIIALYERYIYTRKSICGL